MSRTHTLSDWREFYMQLLTEHLIGISLGFFKFGLESINE